uniref:Uncharacterized protein n=1 Tax=Anguilla anguilla TaxID=7936 RepID=A0A0E9WI83_ANGAN
MVLSWILGISFVFELISFSTKGLVSVTRHLRLQLFGPHLFGLSDYNLFNSNVISL